MSFPKISRHFSHTQESIGKNIKSNRQTIRHFDIIFSILTEKLSEMCHWQIFCAFPSVMKQIKIERRTKYEF